MTAKDEIKNLVELCLENHYQLNLDCKTTREILSEKIAEEITNKYALLPRRNK